MRKFLNNSGIFRTSAREYGRFYTHTYTYIHTHTISHSFSQITSPSKERKQTRLFTKHLKGPDDVIFDNEFDDGIGTENMRIADW